MPYSIIIEGVLSISMGPIIRKAYDVDFSNTFRNYSWGGRSE